MTAAPPVVGNVEKDIQDKLLHSRQPRRKQGEVPYPLEYSNGMADYDIWEHMFLVSSCRGLTMHSFDHRPEVVLDLGCGGGYWALEAAKQWTSSTIVGFDIARIQPNLQDLEHYRHLAHRVKWAHGNMLDGLPFPSSQFDFVRIAYIGLGVPEDEWQFVLEEVSRVMKPGAVLELIEEDLIFPCTTLPSDPPLSPKLSDLDLSFRSLGHSDSSNAMSLLDPNSTLPERKPPSSPLRNMYEGFTRRTASKVHLAALTSDSSFQSHFSSSSKVSDISMAKKHPQDHTRIKAAWDSLLSSRFICPTLLSILPFYLSTFFSDVKTHPPYQVALPPNSNSLPPLRSRHSAESFRPSSRGGLGGAVDVPFKLNLTSVPRSTSRADAVTVRSMYSTRNLDVPHRWTSMHLGRSVNTITACKDPIRREYQKLFHQEYMDQYLHSDVSLHHLFDRDWNSWLNDMTDRISMRDRMDISLSWPETPGDKPECRKWRGEFEKDRGLSQDQETPQQMHHDPNDLCRSVRVFVAKKAS